MAVLLKAFKAARLFSPHYVKKVNPESALLDSLSALPFISVGTLSQLKLKEEFPKYVVLTNDVSSDCTAVSFWKDSSTTLPDWSNAAKKVLLMQPSSAAAERVFSLNNCFGDQQLSSLEDYVETSVMIQY